MNKKLSTKLLSLISLFPISTTLIACEQIKKDDIKNKPQEDNSKEKNEDSPVTPPPSKPEDSTPPKKPEETTPGGSHSTPPKTPLPKKPELKPEPEPNQTNPSNNQAKNDLNEELILNSSNFRKINDKNKYPDYVNRFKKIDSQILYKEIYDRSFSIKFATLKNEDKTLISNGSGTGWLLDYYKYKSNPNKYKLFIATNLHVLSLFSNSLDDNLNKELNYFDPSGDKVIGVALGKAKSKPQSFEPISNNETNNFSLSNNLKVQNYYTNSDEFEKYDKDNVSIVKAIKSPAISTPKIVFSAIDFMHQDIFLKYQDDIRKNAISYLGYKINESSTGDEYYKNIYKNLINENPYIPMMVDFGVFEVDIDLDKANEELKKWIIEAIEGLNSYLKRIADTEILPNQNKEISSYMLTTDYISALGVKNNQDNLYNLENIYIAGYPVDSHQPPLFVKNNPLERYIDETRKHQFAFPQGNYENKIEFANNLDIQTGIWNRIFAHWYGYHYNINFSSLYYGASGSLVYNEFGQMIGIYDAVRASVSAGDLLSYGGFAPLMQSHNILHPLGNITYAYNLIDGSNKKNFKHQKNSYKENLNTLYPNGFEDNKDSKNTTLFKEGF
ncbi:MIP family Ig-specific serine endopeptidase [Metamycoplasma auris]|uniref:Putative peptidase DUF31 n=1 Tax=Metamycoplasma auris TaxID=51363 RepID=A0A2W7GPT6_9BACT|nr:DUF31 family protein [Metamycoplasma auris]PZV99902.1 putative peptidase DUF31 [Metamycoplasma auris]